MKLKLNVVLGVIGAVALAACSKGSSAPSKKPSPAAIVVPSAGAQTATGGGSGSGGSKPKPTFGNGSGTPSSNGSGTPSGNGSGTMAGISGLWLSEQDDNQSDPSLDCQELLLVNEAKGKMFIGRECKALVANTDSNLAVGNTFITIDDVANLVSDSSGEMNFTIQAGSNGGCNTNDYTVTGTQQVGYSAATSNGQPNLEIDPTALASPLLALGSSAIPFDQAAALGSISQLWAALTFQSVVCVSAASSDDIIVNDALTKSFPTFFN